MDVVDGATIDYRDPRYIWHVAIAQVEEFSVCPCSGAREPVKHHVIHDVLWASSADKAVCATLLRSFQALYSALECARDNHPRAAIREQLLLAVLVLNDALLPMPMEQYVNSLGSPGGTSA